jgi:hypothetical protein
LHPVRTRRSLCSVVEMLVGPPPSFGQPLEVDRVRREAGSIAFTPATRLADERHVLPFDGVQAHLEGG